MAFCPKCGKENPEDARFCMHCGVYLSGYKVEISPKIDVSPKIEVRTNAEKAGCDICGERKAIVTCRECGKTVCNFHFENETKCCTLCTISHFESIVRACEKKADAGGKKCSSNDAEEWIKYHRKAYREYMEGYREFHENWYLEVADISREAISVYSSIVENEKKIEKLKRKLPPEQR